jgi:fumarate hydratase subunit alpha
VNREDIIEKTKETLLRAASTFRSDQIEAYRRAMDAESNDRAGWVLETILENARTAEQNCGPLCDDTGIPHLLLELGRGGSISRELIDAIREGVALGLRQLPGRPMAVMGDDRHRLDQSDGLSEDPADMVPAPLMICETEDPVVRLTILMQGGGPEIRSNTYRVFHKHSVDVILHQIVEWASAATAKLGCTPSTLAVGIGRSHYEASSLMLQAMAGGSLDVQSDLEKEITTRVNQTGTGPLGLGGGTTVLGTFLRVGPQRASGVRIVCLRPCCCFEPRRASVEL